MTERWLDDIASYDYVIPSHLIAQNPSPQRDSSRLMRLFKSSGAAEHRMFSELPDILSPGDLLVMNDTRVFKARVRGKKIPGGASAEIFFLSPADSQNEWRALVRPGRKLPPGTSVLLADGTVLEITGLSAGGSRIVKCPDGLSLRDIFERFGSIPLPPYIKHTDAPDARYQTIYSNAGHNRSVAAPTAGLHFTPELLARLRERGIEMAFLTLDVGIGTFRPVKTADIREHKMHSERCEMDEACADAVNAAKSEGRRTIAVGTTAVRTLESFADSSGLVSAGTRDTDIFIRPGYHFKVPDALITNFHLPKSTLLMLSAAFAGYQNTMNAYAEAIALQYRFFSFGDAMLIE
ncbi:MAG: tRNA preQ1(34) S-adenosylmethionine ribosyltransferase-isomerase QueA [Synergistaceae bacterium]|nr:tRNA preQ1(34) S-adenosylmethionine ribosyltransferase-isomerase QueA [Synergistaceae bacterium]